MSADRILVVGGLFQLLVGFVSGIPYAAIRSKQPEASKYLRFVHVGGLMQAPILLSLILVLPYSPLSERLELWAAALLSGSAFCLTLKDTINWLQGTKDEFAERSLGSKIGALVPLLGFVGLGILTIGVVMGALR